MSWEEILKTKAKQTKDEKMRCPYQKGECMYPRECEDCNKSSETIDEEVIKIGERWGFSLKNFVDENAYRYYGRKIKAGNIDKKKFKNSLFNTWKENNKQPLNMQNIDSAFNRLNYSGGSQGGQGSGGTAADYGKYVSGTAADYGKTL